MILLNLRSIQFLGNMSLFCITQYLFYAKKKSWFRGCETVVLPNSGRTQHALSQNQDQHPSTNPRYYAQGKFLFCLFLSFSFVFDASVLDTIFSGMSGRFSVFLG